GLGAAEWDGGRPHHRAHHPPLHARLEGRAQRLVSGNEARHGRGEPRAQARTVRLAQVRLQGRDHARASQLVRGGDRRATAPGPHPLLDL
ncbi:MAG: Spore photoproduct lyase, partial [uncultured Solirubrobacterales bacterium]